jgi:hypothetical protein
VTQRSHLEASGRIVAQMLFLAAALALSGCGPTGPAASGSPRIDDPSPSIDDHPVASSGCAVELDDGEAVIGVTAGVRPRGYVLRAFDEAPGGGLVVRDQLDGQAVVVARRDGYHSVEVSAGEGSPPIAPHLPGDVTSPGRDKAPFAVDLKWELTDWGSWRRAHPDTDVYLGPRRRAREP